MYFHLERFKNGHPAQTESGDYVKFVSVLSDNTPAKLIVEKRGVMENYYLNGTFHGSDNRCEEDLELMDYPLTALQHKKVYPFS